MRLSDLQAPTGRDGWPAWRAVVLLVCLFALPWYGLAGAVATIAQRLGVSTSLTGWESLTTLRWLILVTIARGAGAGVPAGHPQRAGDARGLSVIVTVLGVLTALGLVYRVLIAVPGPDVVNRQAGGFIGWGRHPGRLRRSSLRRGGRAGDESTASRR